MYLLIFSLIVCVGLFTAYRLLWPEMYVKVGKPQFNFPWAKPHLREDVTHEQIVVDAPRVEMPQRDYIHDEPVSFAGSDKIQKLEALLFEKNKTIDRLQTQLDNERSHRKEFENVKNIMDEEIKHLREQLRAFRNYYKEKADA